MVQRRSLPHQVVLVVSVSHVIGGLLENVFRLCNGVTHAGEVGREG